MSKGSRKRRLGAWRKRKAQRDMAYMRTTATELGKALDLKDEVSRVVNQGPQPTLPMEVGAIGLLEMCAVLLGGRSSSHARVIRQATGMLFAEMGNKILATYAPTSEPDDEKAEET